MQRGELYLTQGPMGCSKSEHTLIWIRKAVNNGKKFIAAFKPKGDIIHPGKIESKAGESVDAIEIPDDNPREIRRELEEFEAKNKRRVDVVVVDEAQFFKTFEFFWTVKDLLDDGYDVYVAGLTTNFRGEPFGAMQLLSEIAPIGNIHKPVAWCKCGKKGTFTQRLLPNGELAPWDSLEKVAGDIEIKKHGGNKPDFIYAARCERCFVRPPQ
jgi:thymidine kinase